MRRPRKKTNYILFPLLPSSAWSGSCGALGLIGLEPLPAPAPPPLLISTMVPWMATPAGPMTAEKETKCSLSFFAVASSVTASGGRSCFIILPFEPAHVGLVPHAAGIYIIYKRDGTPYYVGRSRVDIFGRLWKHVNKMGSKRIREALERGIRLDFEYQEMISPEQAEAILVKELGVLRFGNLRRESDPADWA
jgi:predicted GIY-YIG superfamily endonuclease